MDVIRTRKSGYTGDSLRLHLNERVTPLWHAHKAEWDNLQRYPDLNYYYEQFENIIGHKRFFTEGISGAVKEIMAILRPRAMQYQGTWALYEIFNKLYGTDLQGPVIHFALNPGANIDSLVEKNDHVIIDDAYQYFHDKDWTPYLKYDNVTIMRTFSKAHGLAGIRLGYIMGELVDVLNMHRGGYEANSLSLDKGLYYLKNEGHVKQYAKEIIEVREFMLDKYKDMKWDGYSNSLYCTRHHLYQRLKEEKILVAKKQTGIRITLAPMPYMRKVFDILDE